MAKALKFGNAILCEYVAKGFGNKHTLVNVFSGDVVVQEMPAKLQFGLYFEYFPDDEIPHEISIIFRIHNSLLFQAQITFPDLKRGSPAAVAIQSFDIQFDRDVTFSIEAQRHGYRKTKVLSKKIFKGNMQ